MASTYSVRKGPNRLLQGMILVSLGIHMLVLMYIIGIYRPKAGQYLELTLREESKPSSQGIPRPPYLPKADEKPSKAKAFQVAPIQIPDVNQMKGDPGDSRFSASLMEGVILLTKEDYYEMVRIRIDREKKYPKEAYSMHKEGRVTLSFVINLEGGMRNLKIVKPSPHKALNEAALQAVRDSVPFMKPPPILFKEDIPIELNVTFELI